MLAPWFEEHGQAMAGTESSAPPSVRLSDLASRWYPSRSSSNALRLCAGYRSHHASQATNYDEKRPGSSPTCGASLMDAESWDIHPLDDKLSGEATQLFGIGTLDKTDDQFLHSSRLKFF